MIIDPSFVTAESLLCTLTPVLKSAIQNVGIAIQNQFCVAFLLHTKKDLCRTLCM